jgi:hypothetical protein
MAENQNQSVGSSGQTTSTTKPADPDPILKQNPDINDAEDKQQKQHEVEEKKKQSGQ